MVIAPFTRQELADLWEFDRRVERGTERYELNAREKPLFEDYPDCRAAVDAAMKKGRIVYRPDALKQLHRMGLRNYDRIVEATGVSRSVLWKSITHRAEPGRNQIAKVLYRLQVPMETLFEYRETERE